MRKPVKPEGATSGELLHQALVIKAAEKPAGRYNRVRITAQLVGASTGDHLWAEHYDRQIIFALQGDIVQQILGNLKVKVFEAELTRVRRIPILKCVSSARATSSVLRDSKRTSRQWQ